MKRFAITVLVIMGAVIVLWTAGWFIAADQIQKGVASLEQNDGETLPRVTCGTIGVGGFPFRFNVTCTEAVIVSGDITTALPTIRATALAYHPTQLVANADGPMTLTDAFTGSASSVTWGDAELSLRLEGWRIGRMSLIADNVNWNDALFNVLIGSTAHLEAHLLDIPERHDATSGTAALAGYSRLTGVVAPGLGVMEGETEVEVEINNVPDDVRVFGDYGALIPWQQNGGSLTIVSARGQDAGSTIEGSGTISLDDSALLDGQLSVTSNGVIERTGELFPEPVRTLFFGQPSEDGTYRQLLTIQSGVVLSGVVPMATIPPLY
jgi:hypothetical protein